MPKQEKESGSLNGWREIENIDRGLSPVEYFAKFKLIAAGFQYRRRC